MTLDVVETIGKTRDGGSCAECDGDYRGAPYEGGRGRRVLAVIEPGVVEPVNVCVYCYRRAWDGGRV